MIGTYHPHTGCSALEISNDRVISVFYQNNISKFMTGSVHRRVLITGHCEFSALVIQNNIL